MLNSFFQKFSKRISLFQSNHIITWKTIFANANCVKVIDRLFKTAVLLILSIWLRNTFHLPSPSITLPTSYDLYTSYSSSSCISIHGQHSPGRAAYHKIYSIFNMCDSFPSFISENRYSLIHCCWFFSLTIRFSYHYYSRISTIINNNSDNINTYDYYYKTNNNDRIVTTLSLILCNILIA